MCLVKDASTVPNQNKERVEAEVVEEEEIAQGGTFTCDWEGLLNIGVRVQRSFSGAF